MTAATKTIHQLLAEAAGLVGPVGKEGKMTGHASYSFRKADDVINAVSPVFADLGIVMIPQIVESEYVQGQTRNGSPQMWCRLTVSFTFFGPKGDSVTASTIGEALDTSDKSTNKAHTAALKNALTQVLLLPFEGDDPEYHRPEANTKPAKASKAAPAPNLEPEDAVVLEQGDLVQTDEPRKAKVKPAEGGRVCGVCGESLAGHGAVKHDGAWCHQECVNVQEVAAAPAQPEFSEEPF